MNLIKSGEFFQKITPTFAFGFGSDYPIRVLLENNINISGTSSSVVLNRGVHTIELNVNEGDDGSKDVQISKTSNSPSRNVPNSGSSFSNNP